MAGSIKSTIGWVEYVRFPQWDLGRVKAKIDTGARTSALHVENLRLLNNGQIQFEVALGRRKPFTYKTVTTHLLRQSRVRSSTGEYQLRPFILAKIKLGTIVKSVEVSLVSRKSMLFRMLLGRKALEKDFLVDVSRRNLLPDQR